MSLDVVPIELLAVTLVALTLALPVSVPLAAGATAGERERWNSVGLALGGGLLLGVLGAIVLLLAGKWELAALVAALTQIPGLLLILVAAMLSLLRLTGPRIPWVLGLIGCLLTGIGEPLQQMPALGAITSSTLVQLVGIVAGAIAVAVLVGLLVAAAARADALVDGLAVGGAVGVLVLLVAMVPGVGIGLVVQMVLILIGIVGGIVLSVIRSRTA